MTEAIVMNEAAEVEKRYTFRQLSTEDMFLMFRILGKIGVKEFKQCFEGDSLNTLINTFKNNEGNDVSANSALMAIGVSVGFDAVDIILNNLPKCEKEICKLLSQVSGMDEAEIKKDAILFTEMVIDFVKKEEFPAFIKVVSRLFK